MNMDRHESLHAYTAKRNGWRPPDGTRASKGLWYRYRGEYCERYMSAIDVCICNGYPFVDDNGTFRVSSNRSA